jgi:hypothetical protein
MRKGESKSGWVLFIVLNLLRVGVLTQLDSSSEQQLHSAVRDIHLYLFWGPS